MTPPSPAPGATPGLSTRYRVRHATAYDYGEDVPISHHLLHLSARPHPRQRIRRSLLTIDPVPAVRTERVDYFGNTVTYVAVQEPHRTFSVIAESEVEVFELLAERRTDREIADSLSISPRTVMRHVSNILGKLDLASRRDVETWVARQQGG